VPIVLKSGNLNFLESSGPVQAYNGKVLPFTRTQYKSTNVDHYRMWPDTRLWRRRLP